MTSSLLLVGVSVKVTGQASLSVPLPSVVTAVEPDRDVVSTPHMCPDWWKHLKLNFNSVVVDQCSKKVRDAVELNRKFEKIQDIREVRLALIHTTIDYIVDKFGGVSKPKLV